MLHTDKILFSDFYALCPSVVVNEVLWGTWNGGRTTAYTRSYGEARSVAANSVAQVAKTACDSCIVWVVQRGGDLSWKDDRREKDRVCESICKTVSYIEHYHGNIGRNCDSCGFAFGIGGTDFERYGKRYLRIMFFVMSYFVVGQAINTTLVVGVFRSGGDTRFGLILDMTTMWCCSILFGFLAAFVFKLSVPVVYVILMSDEIIKIRSHINGIEVINGSTM